MVMSRVNKICHKKYCNSYIDWKSNSIFRKHIHNYVSHNLQEKEAPNSKSKHKKYQTQVSSGIETVQITISHNFIQEAIDLTNFIVLSWKSLWLLLNKLSTHCKPSVFKRVKNFKAYFTIEPQKNGR